MNFAHFDLNMPFMSKKVLYTDFDGTYFPYKKEDIVSKNRDDFASMYLPFDSFQKKDNNSIIVTTGRSKNDFLNTISRIFEQNLPFALPKGLITSNGACEFQLTKEGGQVKAYDKSMGQDGLDGVLFGVLDCICEDDENIFVFETRINGRKDFYGGDSSENILDSAPKDKRKKYISYAKDGNYSVELVVSKDIDFSRTVDSVKKYIKENKLPFSIEAYRSENHTVGVEYRGDKKEYTNANVIFLKHSNFGLRPDKSVAVRERIKEILDEKSDDIVIVAGDGINDIKMLNPLSYLDLVYDGKFSLQDKKTVNALNSLPLRSIICGSDPELDNLRVIAKILNKSGCNIITCAPDSKKDFVKSFQDYTG